MEFRSIPSLGYEYAVNEDGTMFINLKTKKYLKIILDIHHSTAGYYKTMIHIERE